MKLTSIQTDALTELINIGYGRAAGSLSELTGYRVNLEVPQISIVEIERVGPLVAQLLGGEIATVSQIFNGAISGNALLLLEEKSAIMLSRLLSDDSNLNNNFDANGREIITEVGNILLNACLGVFGNLLQVQVTFAVPRLQVTDVGRVLESVTIASDELKYGLMIHTRFQLRVNNVSGYLIIVLGITSLERLQRELDNWERRQTT